MSQKTPPKTMEPPKIEYPCPDYPIKVIGKKSDQFQSLVVEIINVHVPDFDESRITIQDSSKGTYCSLRMFITATGEQQLKDLHEQLIASDQVHLVL
ncbi:DUF493 domain-containing protein [Neptunomonas phycophila]|jgi:putative lipoic acid-binding regulatory protein|uniref:UPF0250 protein Q4490_09450 n=2 Tax=Neptunomonas phycophila TaxID=1572645 RepID=A0AAW7XI28_9GAMM|nr:MULTISPECIES: DUF493 domain-containing protein [Neptunomonas]MBT3144710.1 DUF493 domain-containing protein [Neptunomonas phycophila]MDO6453790.1 DUF493 domain-containing protein [Neptunomonas phycophila]MDO6467899.1 DUF493 domain-containing protein [Neptunomonas phycophila]MDP2523438.1 DUF493 domain-containing protein [Neptunomonas phycophila]QLE99427.1 DUF493 family protein [Neptunomonas phycophila]